MKVAYVLCALIGVALAAPKIGKTQDLSSRNVYKKPRPDAKPAPIPPHSRIVGGEIAEPHSRPFQAFLVFYAWNGGWSCGGSLITPNYVLTAGHCGFEALEAFVVLGAQDIDEDEDSQLVIVSYKIIVHDLFDFDYISYDIALIRLPHAVQLNQFIGLVPLPSLADVNKTYVGQIGVVSGWGLLHGRDDELPSLLRYTENPIITNRACSRVYWVVEDYQVCMSGDEGRSSCNGDSGGPFTVDGVLVGIVSYGVEYCEPGYPSAFTRTTSFLDWIAENSDVQLV